MRKPAVEQAGGAGKFGESQMIVTTMDRVAGSITEETLGVVRGTAFWELCRGLYAARESAIKAMEEQACKLGADAIIGLGVEVIEAGSRVFCVNVTGTAVTTMKLPQSIPVPGARVAEDFDFEVSAHAARPSFAGSALRH